MACTPLLLAVHPAGSLRSKYTHLQPELEECVAWVFSVSNSRDPLNALVGGDETTEVHSMKGREVK